MADNAAGVVPPLSFELITGGRSNLTFRVADTADGRWVLRRPPLGHVLATAHAVAREHRIIDALTGTDVPVPPLVGLCTDETVNGAPFYVMEHVEGIVALDAESGEAVPVDARRAVTEALVDGLVAI